MLIKGSPWAAGIGSKWLPKCKEVRALALSPLPLQGSWAREKNLTVCEILSEIVEDSELYVSFPDLAFTTIFVSFCNVVTKSCNFS